MKLKTALTAVSVAAMVWGGGAAQLQSAPHPRTSILQTKEMETDSNGDWFGLAEFSGRPSGRLPWRVVDPDPNGLNCRMRGTFENATRLGNSPDILSMPVVATLPYGSEFEAAPMFATVYGVRTTIADNRGLPWVYSQDHGCFVRANSAFVEPLY